jgi:hypothetical protein
MVNSTENGALRKRIREAIQAGRLPRHRAERMWGGPGCGDHVCTICGERIGPDQVEFELEYAGARNGNGNGAAKLYVDLACLGAWNLERAEAQLSRSFKAGLSSATGDGTIAGSEREDASQRDSG